MVCCGSNSRSSGNRGRACHFLSLLASTFNGLVGVDGLVGLVGVDVLDGLVGVDGVDRLDVLDELVGVGGLDVLD